MVKLDVKACGVALGLVAAATVLILGTINILFFWAESLRRVISILYIGYRPSLIGVIFSSMWAFAYAFVLGAVFARLYNRITEENKIEMDARIKKLAHDLWEKRGRPENSSDEDWKEAQRIVKGK